MDEASRNRGEGDAGNPLQDFAAVCLAHFDEIVAAAERAMADSPGLGQALRAISAIEWSHRARSAKDALATIERRGAGMGGDPLGELAERLVPPGIALATWTDLITDVVAPVLASHLAPSEGHGDQTVALLALNRQLARVLMAIALTQKSPPPPAISPESFAARYTRLAQSGIIGIIVVDRDRHPIEINDALLAIVGYTRAEVLAPGFRFVDITPPEWRHSDEQAAEQVRTHGVSALREKEYLRKDGTRVPVLAGSALVDSGSGEIISFVLDISERKRADAAIRRLSQERAAEAKFRGLLEAAPDAMVIIDKSGRIVLVNVRAETLFGYLREELLGRPAAMLMAERFRHDVAERRERFLSAPSPSPSEASLRLLYGQRKDGSEFPIEVSSSPLASPDGPLVSSTIRDVTERQRVEAALKASASQLAAANRELEAFSYSVAHDLRAPLRGMGGFAQILLDDYKDKLEGDGRDCLLEIHANAKRMGALIDALLSLSRVTRSDFRLARVDLSALARSVAASLAADEPQRSVELIVPDGLVAAMDPSLARMLLENLLGNAWKFTMNTVQARVELGCTVQGEQAVFFVRDNGAGFDMAFAEKLFTPFQRLHTVREFPGTGIGLASVQRIINRHGGRVWAEGQVGRGATLWFTLSVGEPS